jgi:PAS domain S-box-containing protein
MADGENDMLEGSVEALYEHAPCGLLSTSPDGTIIRANQTFLDLIGRAPEEVFGRIRFQSLLTVGSQLYYETHYAPLLQMQGAVNEIALELRRAEGNPIPVFASARQVRAAAGTVVANRIAIFDSRDRRRYERELLAARKVAEQQAVEIAQADRQKSVFIAMLAHELRNPLAPIRHAVEIIRRVDHRNETVTKTTNMMGRQVAQMVRLIDDLMDASRLAQDKIALRRVPVDLASVIHHAVEMAEPLLESAGLTWTVTLLETPIYVEADAGRLAQVLGNLLNNAAKFTPRDGTVSVVLERDQSEAVIRVRDSGLGIEKDKLAEVFELFMQADVSLEGRGGLGLGLTLAKSLVERHDGRIMVHSEGLGMGTEFAIRLPALSGALESVSRAFGPQIEAVAATKPRRVLVVDDNDDAAQLISMLLEFAGHQVRIAHDGLEAVEIASAFQPHVVILDIGLPRLNGYEAAQRIRQQAGMQPVLVALTGWGQDEDRRKSIAAGFDLHLVKPVDHDVLTQLIADLPPMNLP